MKNDILLDLATEIGYRLAMSGAETFRVEDSINRILSTYGIESEVFAIPNCMTVSIKTNNGQFLTRMRRVGHHGNDLDCVEQFSNLSRRICSEKPPIETALLWLESTKNACRCYPPVLDLLGHFLGAFGFALFFGGTVTEGICSGVCGVIIGLVNRFLGRLRVNPFFTTIASAFLMALAAYSCGAIGIASNTDSVVIGALMLLVPGLLFTNAMRDIIFGDTNSGTNRIVQVLLVAAAIALGTGAAWNLSESLFGVSVSTSPATYNWFIQCVASCIGCLGFSLIFNIHGPGVLLCVLGGGLSWAAYCAVLHFSGSDILAYFGAAIASAAYSEAMARIRKYPAISYLVVSIFPMIPGASIYYTTGYVVRGDMAGFADKGTHTIAIAGAIAVGILMVSTLVRLWGVWNQRRKKASV